MSGATRRRVDHLSGGERAPTGADAIDCWLFPIRNTKPSDVAGRTGVGTPPPSPPAGGRRPDGGGRPGTGPPHPSPPAGDRRHVFHHSRKPGAASRRAVGRVTPFAPSSISKNARHCCWDCPSRRPGVRGASPTPRAGCRELVLGGDVIAPFRGMPEHLGTACARGTDAGNPVRRTRAGGPLQGSPPLSGRRRAEPAD